MRVSVVDFEFPEPDRSSGGHRMSELVAMMVGAGHEVSFLAFDYWRRWGEQDGRYRGALESMGVRCAFEPGDGVGAVSAAFFQEAMPDVAVLSRYYVFNCVAPYLQIALPSCRLVLDTVDVHHVRERRMLEVKGFGDPEGVMRGEAAALGVADRTWAVTGVDAEACRRWARDVVVVPNVHQPVPGGLPRGERSGVVFVGNYEHRPNWDGVWWFSNHVLPMVSGGEPFRAVGAGLAEDGYGDWRDVECVGWVPDLAAYLGGCLVAVAPLRFGSGMKGKIGDYLAAGVPTVTTSVGAEGMGLADGREVLVRDEPRDFAEAVSTLCRDESLWGSMGAAGREWASGFSREAVAPGLEGALAF